MKTLLNSLSIALLFTMVLFSCEKLDNSEIAGPVSANKASMDCTPSVIQISGTNNGGNVTCDEAAAATGMTYAYSSGRISWDATTKTFSGTFPAGFTITVNADGTVSWSYKDPAGVWCLDGITFLVKGGSLGVNAYTYGTDCSTGSGLVAMMNPKSGKPFGLSNLTFCYNLKKCAVEECDGTEETGFGGSANTAGGGNAWWYYMDTQGATLPMTSTIYAGQKATDGTITWDGTYLTINLGSMKLADVSEAIKVQTYDTLPSTRQPAGQFTTYKGNELKIKIDSPLRYFVVHLDLLVCEKSYLK